MSHTNLMLLFLSASGQYELPPGLLSNLCFVESKHNPEAIHHDDGNGDSLGVCQIKLNTARLLGFKGTARELMIPAINIKYAAMYLKRQLTRYKGHSPMAVAAYNAGKFRPGKVFALNQKYVDKVFTAWGRDYGTKGYSVPVQSPRQVMGTPCHDGQRICSGERSR